MNIHMFITWANGMPKQNSILETLKCNFQIINVYEMELNTSQTLEIMMGLYDFTHENALEKISSCGSGKINIILVQDETTDERIILTKYGYIPVHKYAYEVKLLIREQIGSPALFHGTMTDFELEHDYFTCFHQNADLEALKKAQLWNGISEEVFYEQ